VCAFLLTRFGQFSFTRGKLTLQIGYDLLGIS
jgi:hypothetical protein